MMTTEERFETMQSAFDKAARSVVAQARATGFAVVEIEPGDATCYRFVFVTPRDWEVWREDDTDVDVVRPHKYWSVTLTMGLTYEWGGQHIHWDYAHKWVIKQQEWTQRVVAALLNAIADQLHQGE